MQLRECLTYDDVLLSPKYSDIVSRSEVDVSVVVKNSVGKEFKFSHPIIPANMSNITELDMAKAMYLVGGMSMLHRFAPFETQMKWIDDVKSWGENSLDYVGFSIGVQKEDYSRLDYFADKGANIINIDVAHAHSKQSIEMIRHINKTYPHILIMSGSVATSIAAKELWEAGANIVRVGIGGGSVCLTRIETGAGVPQLTAIMDVANERKNHKDKYMISDGGISKVGDVVKSLCLSDFCMLGNMLAGTDEAPGETKEIEGVVYKKYAGSSTHKKDHIEGVVGWVPTKGSVNGILQKILQGLKSGCSYQGARNLQELKSDPHFVKITRAGFVESGAHDLKL